MLRSALGCCAVGMIAASCCGYQQRAVDINDRLESHLILGAGSVPSCILPKPRNVGHRATIGEPIPLWAYSSYADSLTGARGGIAFSVDALDAHGDPLDDRVYEVDPPSGVTEAAGTSRSGAMKAMFFQPGVYRLRAEFSDRRTTGISYSAPIVVFGEGLDSDIDLREQIEKEGIRVLEEIGPVDEDASE